MCTIIAKKFKNIGWVGVKNRDRPAPTNNELMRDQIDSEQRVTLLDEQSKWSEGMNSHSVSIISSSLSVVRGGLHHHDSKDGLKIKNALAERTVEAAVKNLERNKICGCVMVFDKNQLWLIEGNPKTHELVIKQINENYVARTNHGIWIKSAGYQKNNNDKILDLRRIGSEARLLIANYIGQTDNNPYDLLPLLAKQWNENNQLTTLRFPTELIDSRTTEQLMLIPGQKLILLRNTNGKLEFNQKDANQENSKVLVGLIDE